MFWVNIRLKQAHASRTVILPNQYLLVLESLVSVNNTDRRPPSQHTPPIPSNAKWTFSGRGYNGQILAANGYILTVTPLHGVFRGRVRDYYYAIRICFLNGKCLEALERERSDIMLTYSSKPTVRARWSDLFWRAFVPLGWPCRRQAFLAPAAKC